MANRMKEDEKNERIIRGLLKLPENRKCVNCNSLGPQYVCTNFWTFVCTTCGGIHREFTHRVKSISMAKFSSQEVAALQGGGNSQAKEIYLKEFDPQRQSFPDSSNVERLRNFIKHVYVDRRYTGDRSSDKPPRVKMGDELYENKRSDTFQGGPQGPPYEDAYERRHSSRPSSGGRSDDSNYRYNYEERRSPNYSDHKRSPSRLEVVNDWRREDRFGDGRKTEDHRISDGDFKTESRSPVRIPSPPVVRPVREILGENVPPIRILEPPKANGGRNGPSQRQRTNSSSSSASTSGNLVEHTADVSASLIDFDADPQPSVASAVPETKQTTSVQSQPVNSLCDTNWASFDFPTEAKISQSPPVTNTLNSVLSQLSIPSSGPGHLTTLSTSGGTAVAPMGTMPIFPNRGNIPIAPLSHTLMSTPAGGLPTPFPVDSLSAFTPSSPAPASHWTSVMSVNCNNSFAEGSSATPWFRTQAQQHSLYPATGIQSSAQQLTPSVEASSNLPWASSLASNAQGPTSASPTQALQAVSKSTLEVASGVMPQPSPVEVKSSGRRELSEDLFASRYPSNSLPIPGWQAGGPGVLGFGMQYNTEAAFQSYLQPSRSTNPFDLNNDSAQLQTPSFPSMTSLQGALPNMPTPRALMHHPQAPSYTYAMPPGGGSMGEQLPGGIHPSGHQGHGGFGSSGASFGSLNSNQPPAGSYPGSVNPSSFSSFGGNPFG